jgi:hypothetical protein
VGQQQQQQQQQQGVTPARQADPGIHQLCWGGSAQQLAGSAGFPYLGEEQKWLGRHMHQEAAAPTSDTQQRTWSWPWSTTVLTTCPSPAAAWQGEARTLERLHAAAVGVHSPAFSCPPVCHQSMLLMTWFACPPRC